ncbi:hypothetical protein QQX98_004547 [Neonectria punicea]|uniref:Uncharacterized protein n=1 Tax=Neonectria punicea TaxID=979145 RepID=A0ABR1H8I6_9HYPO
MAHLNSAIPRLHLQPPIVDFIQNRLPQHHPGFVNPPVHYDPTSGNFVPNNQALIERPDNGVLVPPRPHVIPATVSSLPPLNETVLASRPAWEDTTVMVFWNRIFSEALAKFQLTVEPKGRSKTEYSIRNERDWDAIYGKLEKAQSIYQKDAGAGGWLRKVRRKGADNVTPVAETARIVGKLVPDSVFSTPIAGAVQVLLDAVKTAAEVRGKVLQGLDSLMAIFSDVELFLGTFPKDASIHNASVELTVTTLEAIEHAIGFFISNEMLKGVKALGMGTSYEAQLLQSLEAINEKSRSLMEEGAKSHIFEFHMYSQETRKIGKQMLERQMQIASDVTGIKDLLADHVQQRDREMAIERERHKREMQAARKTIALLEVENFRLHSVSPGAQNMWLPPPPQAPPALEWYIDQYSLRQMLNSGDIDVADMDFVASKKNELSSRDRVQAEQIVNNHLFRNWITSPSSAKLLVHWDRKLPKSIAGVSPLSVFCISMVTSLRANDRFVAAVWLCGLHVDAFESSVGTGAMLVSLIDQLLRQHAFDMHSLLADGINIDLVQGGNVGELFKLLEWLVRRLPETITFVCIVDAVLFYEREEMEALDVFAGLLRLVSDQSVRAAIKLLFTSTPGTDIVRGAFEMEDLILNVDGLTRLGWAPSEERVHRELAL